MIKNEFYHFFIETSRYALKSSE